MDATDTNSTEQLLKLNDTLRLYSINLSVFIMVACVETEELSLGDIGSKLGITAAGMTSIRDTADKGGFIEEVQEADRRKRVYRITDLGRELLASCRQ